MEWLDGVTDCGTRPVRSGDIAGFSFDGSG
jgi:hypothetical protein